MPCGGSDAEQTGACHWKVIWDASSLLVRPGEPGLSGPGPNALLSSLPSTMCLWSMVTASTEDDRDNAVDIKRPGEKPPRS